MTSSAQPAWLVPPPPERASTRGHYTDVVTPARGQNVGNSPPMVVHALETAACVYRLWKIIAVSHH